MSVAALAGGLRMGLRRESEYETECVSNANTNAIRYLNTELHMNMQVRGP